MNDLLICNYNKCNKYLEEPVILPCSKNVCKAHIDELVKVNYGEQFKCFICNDEHEVSKNGFIFNEAIDKIINLNFHLNENQKIVNKWINKLKEDIHHFESLVNDPEGFIFDYFSKTRNLIDSERERLIYEINNLSDEMLNKLKKYEENCKQKLTELNSSNKQLNSYLAKVTSEIMKMKEEMRIPKIDTKRVDQCFNELNQLIKDIEENYSSYKNELMLNKKCSFSGKKTKFDEKLFGELLFCSTESNNSFILSSNQFNDLINLCEFDHQIRFKLLYQATRDGFQSQSFHEKCDEIPNTLTIIKVKGNSNVFGGFCAATWDKSDNWKYDPKAFVFSLINKDNRPFKINITNPEMAIECYSEYGPTFGQDIVILDDSNENQESYSKFGNCYQIDEAMSYLAAGTYNFLTEEIEVYQVII